MNIDIKKMENLSYEQPSLKKYGTMKEFTLANSGSKGDSAGMSSGRATGGANTGSDPADLGFFSGADIGFGDTVADLTNSDGSPGAD